jgi:hypothetical protein
MRNRSIMIAILLLLASIGLSSSLSAQNAAPPKAPSASAAAPARDFSGVWDIGNANGLTARGAEAPLTEWGKQQMATNKPPRGDNQTTASNDPVDQCFPPGIPRLYYHPFPMEILQVPGRVVMVFEYDHFVRFIYTDGRKHPDDLVSTWMGDAIGHWEGDTLVVDTIGFNDKTWMDRLGHPHSEDLHLVERFHRDNDKLIDDITIDDPKAYTKSWTAQRTFQLKPKWTLAEFICADTYLNFSDFQKKTLGK